MISLGKWIVAGAVILPSLARAEIDPTAVCLAMVNTATTNIGLDVSSADVLDTIYDQSCESDGSTKSGSKSAGISAFIESLPISLKGSTTDNETAYKNFCKNYSAKHSSVTSSVHASKVVVLEALKSVNECILIAKSSNSSISYNILTPSSLNIRISIQAGYTVSIHGIHHSPDVACVGYDKANPGKVITYDTAVGQNLDATVGTYAISCDRTPTAGEGDEALFNTSVITVNTSGGLLNILWPPDKLLPIKSANALNAAIADLEGRITKLQQNVDYNTLPIGALIPWFDKAKEPPKGWAKCDGSDKTNCPDLSNLFLLGGSLAKVGDQGGSEKMSVPIAGSGGAIPAGDGWSLNGSHYVGRVDNVSVPKPPYVSVLYLKKVSLN